ncbi:hypothetical protein [Thalassobacter stenotrophicus]|uniref:Uncharacterized protein n=2 Tax=Thalassobacter stenotrophicus TaxID=266809 RepID=A0A0P1EYN9_9RHOB|nr:hypothetical protein [Thalassobacter stenotrophicus]CUH60227.1 hypothetical protein THS5294_01516 [Thalassobacter stenotrophicus]SHI70701.1 hypothetical protein SAMN02744035_01308 [Thalassobacter stenotrophicus DSM 16310]
MAQVPSFIIVNDSGAAVRAQLNQVIAALQTLSSGAQEPADTAPGMLWLDTSTSPPTLRYRDSSDSTFEALMDGGGY